MDALHSLGGLRRLLEPGVQQAANDLAAATVSMNGVALEPAVCLATVLDVGPPGAGHVKKGAFLFPCNLLHIVPKIACSRINFARERPDMRIARRAVINALADKTKGATHYHADYVSPYWAQGERPTKIIGRHLFYKLVEA